MGIADHAGARQTGFPRPFEVTIPRECAGWEEMYAPHVVFADERRSFEESRFWFQDGLHAAEWALALRHALEAGNIIVQAPRQTDADMKGRGSNG